MAERNLIRYAGFHQFEGVDLSSAPDEAACIDMLNVDPFERPGAILTRPAWVNRGPGLNNPIVAFKHGQVQDGADAGDISVYLTTANSSWLGPAFPGGRPLRVVSNELVVSPPFIASTFGSATYDLTASDVEVYATIKDATSPPRASHWLLARWNNVTAEGLILLVDRFSQVALFQGGAALGVGSINASSGDQIALRVLGDTAEVWHKAAAGSWTKVLDVPSVGYTHAGTIGLGALREQGGEPSFDNFGGGAINTPNIAPATPILDDFDRADENPVGGAPSLVAYNRDQDTSASATVAASMFLDAVQYAADSGSVILATENIKTATNVGINVIEADSSNPYVKITPMAYQSGPPDAPDLDYVRFLGVQQPDNRVVAVGVGKGLNHEARVYFSEDGNHTVWPADNYVDLDANDGEVFTGVCNWNGQLWIFKETKAYCFYGNSVDAEGGPIFNYRTINLGTRAVPRNLAGSYALGAGVAAGQNGIYFVGTDGIYMVDGRDAVKISQPIDSLLLGAWGSTGGTSLGVDDLWAGLWYEGRRRLYVNAGHRIYVWDELRRGWLVWQSPAPDGNPVITPWIGPAGTTDLSPALALIDHPDGNNLWSLARPSERSITTDGGDPIPARYRLGFSDFGSDYVDRLEETRVTGTGTVTVTVSKDFERTGQAEELELTDPPSVLGVPGLKRFKHGVSGVVFSTEIEGDAPWAIHRIVHGVTSQKAGGTS